MYFNILYLIVMGGGDERTRVSRHNHAAVDQGSSSLPEIADQSVSSKWP